MKNVFVCVRDIFFLSCCIYNCNHLNLFSIIKLFTNKMQPTMCSYFMSTTALIIYYYNNTKKIMAILTKVTKTKLVST